MAYHPDKAAGGDASAQAAATQRFQELSHAYHVLSDPRLRRIYDQTGSVDTDELRASADDDGRDWTAYWRELFPPVTEKALRDFEVSYKGAPSAPPHTHTGAMRAATGG